MADIQSKILQALRSISEKVSAQNSFEKVISILVESIRSTTMADCCSLYLVIPNKKLLRLAATDGLDKGSVGKASLKFGEGLVGLIGQKQELLNLADAPSHPNFKYLPDVGEDEFFSFLGVPVIYQGKLLGVLVIQCRDKRRFGDQEESFLVTLSSQTASIIASYQNGKDLSGQKARRFKGEISTGGIAIGPAVIWQPPVDYESLQLMYSDDKDLQLELFHQTIFQLQTEMDRVTLEMREHQQNRAVFGYLSGYGSMLDDLAFQDEVDAEILEHGYVASSAVKVVIEKRISKLEAQKADRDKITDLKDLAGIITNRLLHVVSLGTSNSCDPHEKIILAVSSLPAAAVAELPKNKIAGFISIDNTTSSHTAILARDLGIPAVIGVHLDLNEVEGQTVIVDGQNSEVLVSPSESIIGEYRQLLSQSQDQASLFEEEKFEKGVTLDGKRIKIQLNAGLSHEGDDLPQQTDGIGLYRTEIAFMINQSLPTEDQQIEWYKNLFAQFKGLPVCVRTLDIGGDKGLSYLPIEEQNPALGWRGVRVTMDQPYILKTQLRAMLFACQQDDQLEIMVPMVSRLEEVAFVKNMLKEALLEVQEQTKRAIAMPRFGVMIEVPCVAYMMEELATQADFFSIGSNDLIQYLFAVDRANTKVSRFFDPFHPAAVRCLKFLVDKAVSLGRDISVCGEIAGDPLGALLLMSLGYTNLSMNYSELAKVKFLTRRISFGELQDLGKKIVALSSSVDVKNAILQYAVSKGLSRIVEGAESGKVD